MPETTLLRDEPWPDEKDAASALAKLTAALHEVPDTAGSVATSFGRRYEHAGGGWYWSVSWTMEAGSVNQRPHRIDRAKVLTEAIGNALERIEEIRVRDEEAATDSGGLSVT